MKRVVVTGVLVKNSHGQLLLVKKPDDVGPYKGTYLTPGGHIDEGESAEQAARRELYEETGVTCDNLTPRWFFDDYTEDWQGITRHMVGLLYTGDYASGELGPTEGDDDHLEVIRWFSPEQLRDLPLSPPLRDFLLALGYELATDSQKPTSGSRFL